MRETAPFVGLPQLDHSGCGYGLSVDRPLCGVMPTAHLRVHCGWGTVGLVACDDHRSAAAASGRVTGEHVFGELCPEGTCLWIEADDGA
jgi:hypothetical protein